ncbi:hypothetical protein B0A80_05325 [Flavobacterium tructae]|nr:hypothetical protein B0A80_05325 [Flavobacterium tructae]
MKIVALFFLTAKNAEVYTRNADYTDSLCENADKNGFLRKKNYSLINNKKIRADPCFRETNPYNPCAILTAKSAKVYARNL